MQEQEEKSYPICYKCGRQLSPQDGRGWMQLSDDTVWLCANCILESEAVKDDSSLKQDVIDDLKNQLIDVYNAVKVLQNIQPQAMGGSDEKETSQV